MGDLGGCMYNCLRVEPPRKVGMGGGGGFCSYVGVELFSLCSQQANKA